jgi:hypothetical protein
VGHISLTKKGVQFTQPDIVFHGASRSTTTLSAGKTCTNLLQTTGSQAGNIELHNLTLDGNFTCFILLLVNGTFVDSVYKDGGYFLAAHNHIYKSGAGGIFVT